MGLQKIAVKTHGSADEQQFSSAIRMLHDAVQKDVVMKISKAIGEK
jgi:fatty acid/phospholipid biosynthesis enzyme